MHFICSPEVVPAQVIAYSQIRDSVQDFDPVSGRLRGHDGSCVVTVVVMCLVVNGHVLRSGCVVSEWLMYSSLSPPPPPPPTPPAPLPLIPHITPPLSRQGHAGSASARCHREAALPPPTPHQKHTSHITL